MKIIFFLLLTSFLFSVNPQPAARLESRYNPTYLVRHGSSFGGQQKEYLKRAQEIIAFTTNEIQESVKSKKDLKELFFNILDRLATERRTIAQDHKTADSEYFGLRRDLDEPAISHHTVFNAQYGEYGWQILGRLKDILHQMERDKKGFVQKNYSAEDRFLGRSSKIELQIIEKEDRKPVKLGEGRVPEWIVTDILQPMQEEGADWAKFWTAVKRLNLEDPELYSALRLTGAVLNCEKIYPEPYQAETFNGLVEFGNPAMRKSMYVQAKVFFEINGKLELLYEYFTWLYQDKKKPAEDFIEKIMMCSIPIIYHQPELLIEETLKDLAGVFEKIVRWNRSDVYELKQLMALFRYEMACMPFRRGTSAVTEWLERALYDYHQISCQFDENRLADLEAYSNPFFSDFFKAYDSMCSL
jgi:hypothetical protein